MKNRIEDNENIDHVTMIEIMKKRCSKNVIDLINTKEGKEFCLEFLITNMDENEVSFSEALGWLEAYLNEIN
jgi:hypothetical protein